MSSTQVTEGSKSQYLGIRVIEAKILENDKPFTIRVNIKLGQQSWQSALVSMQHSSARIEQSHSFEINDNSVLNISLVSVPLLLSSVEIGFCSLKIQVFSKKTTDWYELENNGKVIAKLLMAFIVDEKSENSPFFPVLQSLELEREQVRYNKMKYLKKIEFLKAEKEGFRKSAKKVYSKIKSQFESNEGLENIINQRQRISKEQKELLEIHNNIICELHQISVGNFKRNSAEFPPKRLPRFTHKSVNKYECN